MTTFETYARGKTGNDLIATDPTRDTAMDKLGGRLRGLDKKKYAFGLGVSEWDERTQTMTNVAFMDCKGNLTLVTPSD